MLNISKDLRNILPDYFDDRLKDNLVDLLSPYIRRLDALYNNYLDSVGNAAYIGNIAQTMFRDMLVTYALDKFQNVEALVHPFLLAESISAVINGNVVIEPGTLLYNEGNIFFYLWPEGRFSVGSNVLSVNNVKIYFADQAMFQVTKNASKVIEIEPERGKISSAIAISVREVITADIFFDRYFPFTDNVLEFYDVAQTDDSYDILILRSYLETVRLYFSERFLQKYGGQEITIKYLNIPNRNPPDMMSYWNERMVNRLRLPLSIALKPNSSGGYYYNLTSAEVPGYRLASMKSVTKKYKYNGYIRSVSDIAVCLQENVSNILDIEVIPYILSANDVNSLNFRKIVYFIVLIANSFSTTNSEAEVNEFISGLSSYYLDYMSPFRTLLLKNSDDILDILSYTGDVNRFKYLDSSRNVYQIDVYSLLNSYDVFIIFGSPNTMRIDIEGKFIDVDVFRVTINNIIGRYQNVIMKSIDFRDVAQFIVNHVAIDDISGVRVYVSNNMMVLNGRAVNPLGDNLYWSYPTSRDSGYMKLIDVKAFINAMQSYTFDANGQFVGSLNPLVVSYFNYISGMHINIIPI
jgi:hypothetical protein